MQLLDQWLPGSWWSTEILYNSIRAYLFAAIVFVIGLIVLKIFQTIVLRRLESLARRTKTDLDDRFIAIFRSLRPPFYAYLAFYVAVLQLNIHGIIRVILNAILIIWIVFQVIKAVEIIIEYLVKRRYANEDSASTRSAIKLLSSITKGALWVLGGLLILQNLGINVTSLIAGLGIGGVAVALALQNILGDLFSSFAIHFDKPFVVGDFIVVGDQMGTVEKIGIKTTRVRALQGEEIVFSNKELTTSHIQNYKRMQERRVVFHIGVEYGTSNDKLQQGKSIITDVINRVEHARLDRVNFYEFGDFALKYEVVYFILSADYNQYMDVHEAVHLGIKEGFEQAGISMAFPTQTIHLNKP